MCRGLPVRGGCRMKGPISGWDVLLACYLWNSEFRGRTRLNKVLAEFQREGVPSRRRFINHHYGPWSPGFR